MKLCIIYHSETGNIRHIAQHLASECDGHLVEVYDRVSYSALTRFLLRCKKARSEDMTPIEPTAIDVSAYDLLVFGSPVWAFKPTPVIHAAITALKGCEGKQAVAFFTHGGRPGQSEEIMKKWIEARGMRFSGAIAIQQKDIEDEKENGELVRFVQAAKHPTRLIRTGEKGSGAPLCWRESCCYPVRICHLHTRPGVCRISLKMPLHFNRAGRNHGSLSTNPIKIRDSPEEKSSYHIYVTVPDDWMLS